MKRRTWPRSRLPRGSGLDVVFVSRQLGHANPNVTLRVYAHVFARHEHADRARPALSIINAAVVGSGKYAALDIGRRLRRRWRRLWPRAAHAADAGELHRHARGGRFVRRAAASRDCVSSVGWRRTPARLTLPGFCIATAKCRSRLLVPSARRLQTLGSPAVSRLRCG
jgi:hypothetical protein